MVAAKLECISLTLPAGAQGQADAMTVLSDAE